MRLIGALLLVYGHTVAQQTLPNELPKNWYQLDQTEDGYYGINLKDAYDFVRSEHRRAHLVTVAIIDMGIDTLHEALKPVLWRNPNEIPGNGRDDDHNGYVDDEYGWNFLGGKQGRNVKEDSYEIARFYHRFKTTYERTKAAHTAQYQLWVKAKAKLAKQVSKAIEEKTQLKSQLVLAERADSLVQIALKRDTYTRRFLDSIPTPDSASKAFMSAIMEYRQMKDDTNHKLLDGLKQDITIAERVSVSLDNPPEDYRGKIMGDNEQNINDRFYGNQDVMAATSLHGTHVAGIIGGCPTDQLAPKGIADHVRIMMVRAVPEGDEHDKDIALAIRYAVDNGAKIINMSFRKDFSDRKNWVDQAVNYAEQKGVLLVHASGNDGANIDSLATFPNAHLLAAKRKVRNWITVGATDATGRIADFSNYGKQEVDVFAPGVKIYSTTTGTSGYGFSSGTSMAAPVVAGTAAFLLAYFPNLSPEQLIYCLERSVQQPRFQVNRPGTHELVYLNELSRTGGIINAYEAARIAASLKPQRTTHARKRTDKLE